MNRTEPLTKDGRFVGKVWVELVAGLYYPEPYSPRLHLSVIRGIRELVEDSKLNLFPTDLPTLAVSKARVDNTDVSGHPLELHWEERELEGVVSQHFVKHIHFSLQRRNPRYTWKTGRRYRCDPLLSVVAMFALVSSRHRARASWRAKR